MTSDRHEEPRMTQMDTDSDGSRRSRNAGSRSACTTTNTASTRLERAIRTLAQRYAAAHPAASLVEVSAPTFRAIVAQRLEALERDVAEVRARVNGLLFVVAGAVATQVILRLFG